MQQKIDVNALMAIIGELTVQIRVLETQLQHEIQKNSDVDVPKEGEQKEG